LSAATFVSAAVNVVFPWSMCPIVPTFTCGFDRSNFSFAIAMCSVCYVARRASAPPHIHLQRAAFRRRDDYFVPCIRATTSSLTCCGACSYRSKCIE
jgi:hypothetical protein